MKKVELNNPFISLRHKNFRYYFIGMCVSTIGTWMQNTAQPWLAYTLTKSALLLSLVSALQYLPILLFSLFAGAIIDRVPKKNILIITQIGAMLTTLALAILTWSGKIQYWHLLITSSLLGIVNTFDMPARQAYMVELAGHDDLMNAIVLNAMTFNVARVLGPSIAGIVMAFIGIPFCFLANSISFGAVLISLFFIRSSTTATVRMKPNEGMIASIKEGLLYIRKSHIVFVTLIISLVVCTFAPNYAVTVPVFAKEILNQGETGYGFLMSAMGIGSLFGALLLATQSKAGPKKFFLYVVPVLVGIILVLVGHTSTYLLTAVTLAITGFLFVTYLSSANSAIQLNTADNFRGRVMSVYTFVNAGSTPIGNLFVGGIESWFGARMGFWASGAAILVFMAPIYLYLNNKKKHHVTLDT